MNLVTLLDAFRERCAKEIDSEVSIFAGRRDTSAASVAADEVRRIDVAAWLASQPAIDVGPRVCVAALVTDPAGFGLFVRNRKRNAASPHPVWELPGGGMLAGETWRQAAAREVCEETGIALAVADMSIQTVLHGSHKPGASFQSLILVVRCTGDGKPVAGDDAIAARWFARHMLPALADLDTACVAREWAGAW